MVPQSKLTNSLDDQLKQQKLISGLKKTLTILDFLRDSMPFSNMVPDDHHLAMIFFFCLCMIFKHKC